MKIISVCATKGGVGKTTLSFNYGEWLAIHKNEKILFVDFDMSCNLTQTYNIYQSENSVAGIFIPKRYDTEILQVKKNIYLLSGSMILDELQSELESKTQKHMMFYLWLQENIRNFPVDFDYIIIDCHPDFGIATKNAIVVSHYILSPLIPNEYSVNSKITIEERLGNYRKEEIEYATGNSYVTAKLYFVQNRLQMNKTISHELLESFQGDNDIIAEIEEKELFNHSTRKKISLVEMEKDAKIAKRHVNFFKRINVQFEKIYKKICE